MLLRPERLHFKCQFLYLRLRSQRKEASCSFRLLHNTCFVIPVSLVDKGILCREFE